MMYKQKLQELCQQRHWALPSYASTKEGVDHNPRFWASVTVNGVTFDGPQDAACRTSKQAQNEAARVAFYHFSPFAVKEPADFPPPSPMSAASPAPSQPPGQSSCMSSVRTEVNDNSTRSDASTSHGLSINDLALNAREMQYLYKNKLQSYAQKRNMNLPVYDSVREGSLHAPHFKASVTVNGQKFESPQLSNTLKDAENAAAKVALLTLSPDVNQEDDKGLYKSILQGMVQNEGLTAPIYHTVSSGPSHTPTFISTVEIQGESFQGGIAKNKKQAESNAAKVAWTRFRECRQTRRPGGFPSTFQVVDIENELSSLPSMNSQLPKTCQANGSPVKPDKEEISGHGAGSNDGRADDSYLSLSVPNDEDPATIPREGKMGSQGNLTECIHNHPKSDDSPSPPLSSAALDARSRDLSAREPVSSEVETPSLFLPAECSGQPSSDSSAVCSVVHRDGSMLPNRVHIYPRKPDFQVPPGTKLLPCSDDKWVAVSAESLSGASFRG